MKSQPINDGICVKYFTLLLYKVSKQKCVRRLHKNSGRVILVSNKLCIKSTFTTRLAEAHAMQFISQNTSIPVPRVHCAFEHKGRTYILMERISGESLSNGWTRRSEESKANILAQLASFIQELRAIPAPERVGVSDVDGGPIFDQRLPKHSLWGPFQTIDDFHSKLVFGCQAKDINDKAQARWPRLAELLRFHTSRPWDESVFTHGDLSSLNILARGDEIVGIVDWGTAGWMPPYWEYTSAWHVNPQNMFWQEEVDKFITPLANELEMEKVRREYFGDF